MLTIQKSRKSSRSVILQRIAVSEQISSTLPCFFKGTTIDKQKAERPGC